MVCPPECFVQCIPSHESPGAVQEGGQEGGRGDSQEERSGRQGCQGTYPQAMSIIACTLNPAMLAGRLEGGLQEETSRRVRYDLAYADQ